MIARVFRKFLNFFFFHSSLFFSIYDLSKLSDFKRIPEEIATLTLAMTPRRGFEALP